MTNPIRNSFGLGAAVVLALVGLYFFAKETGPAAGGLPREDAAHDGDLASAPGAKPKRESMTLDGQGQALDSTEEPEAAEFSVALGNAKVAKDARQVERHPASPAATKIVHGELLTMDTEGNPTGPFDGWLALHSVQYQQPEIPVVGGRFQVEFPIDKPVGEAVFGGVEIPGHNFELRPTAPAMLAASGKLVIHLHELPRIQLRAFDARTGGELEQVTIMAATDVRLGSVPVSEGKTDWESLVHRQPTPVNLTPIRREFRRHYEATLVGSQGYAWQLLDVDPEHDAELLVNLEPGAMVQVALQGPALGGEVELWVGGTAEEGDELLAVLDAEIGKKVDLRWLAQGEYRLFAVLIRDNGVPEILGQVTCSLMAGFNPDVVLLCETPAESKPAALSITIRIPEEWGIENLRASLNPYARELVLSAQKLGPETWLLTSEDAVAGQHSLHLPQLGIQGELVIPETGLEGLVINIPKVVPVTVTTVNAETGEPESVNGLDWYGIPPADPNHPWLGRLSAPTNPQRKASTFELLLPPGQVALFLHEEDRASAQKRFTIGPSGGAIELAVMHAPTLDVLILEDGKPAKGAWEVLAGLEFDGPGRKRRSYETPQGGRLTFSAPGTYEVTLPTSTKFEVTGPAQVVVPAEGAGKLEIEVVRLAD